MLCGFYAFFFIFILKQHFQRNFLNAFRFGPPQKKLLFSGTVRPLKKKIQHFGFGFKTFRDFLRGRFPGDVETKLGDEKGNREHQIYQDFFSDAPFWRRTSRGGKPVLEARPLLFFFLHFSLLITVGIICGLVVQPAAFFPPPVSSRTCCC